MTPMKKQVPPIVALSEATFTAAIRRVPDNSMHPRQGARPHHITLLLVRAAGVNRREIASARDPNEQFDPPVDLKLL